MPGPVSESFDPNPPKKKIKAAWAAGMKRDGFKFFVLKAEDFLASITENQAIAFNAMLGRLERYREKQGKSPSNDYLTINQDEPFADEIQAVMEKHLGPLRRRTRRSP